MAATSSEPRGRPEPCLTWHPCVEEALDSHVLKLRVLLLILPCGVISQESFDKVESQRAEFNVQKVRGLLGVLHDDNWILFVKRQMAKP